MNRYSIALACGSLLLVAAWWLNPPVAAPPAPAPSPASPTSRVHAATRPATMTKLTKPPAFAQARTPAADKERRAEVKEDVQALLEEVDALLDELPSLTEADEDTLDGLRTGLGRQAARLTQALDDGSLSAGMAMVRSARLRASATADLVALVGPKHEQTILAGIGEPLLELPEPQTLSWEGDPRGWEALDDDR